MVIWRKSGKARLIDFNLYGTAVPRIQNGYAKSPGTPEPLAPLSAPLLPGTPIGNSPPTSNPGEPLRRGISNFNRHRAQPANNRVDAYRGVALRPLPRVETAGR